VLNQSLPEEYLDSAVLGKLKLEHIIEEGIFALPISDRRNHRITHKIMGTFLIDYPILD